MSSAKHESSFREGFGVWERGRSSDSGLPLRGLPGLAASGVSTSGVSPHSGGTVPDLHRVPSPCSVCEARPTMAVCRPPPRCACGRRSFSGRPSSSPSPRCPTSAPASGRGISSSGSSRTRPSSRCSARCCCGRSGIERAALALGIAYAASDELHQHFVEGRRRLAVRRPDRRRRRRARRRALPPAGAQVRAMRLAIELDVLGDTRPLWRDWLADAARVLDVAGLPDDRAAAAAELDARGAGNWRTLLERFAEDRAPVYLRPAAEVERGAAPAPGRGRRAGGLHGRAGGARARRARAARRGTAGRRRRGRSGRARTAAAATSPSFAAATS